MGKSKSILIIDDVKDDLDAMKVILKREGYLVTTLLGPKKAISTIEKNSFDLVLIDVDMPGLNGIDLLKILKENYSKKMKLVFVSIILEGDVDTRGADGFIQKPFSIDTFVKKIDGIIKMKK